MGVQLNIKDAETVRLARQLADDTGRSVTAVIRGALEREMEARAAQVEARRARIEAVVAEFRKHMPSAWHGKTSREIMDDIYDDDGLPI